MLNSKGNEKKSRPSGQDDKITINVMELMERIKDETIKSFELNARGALATNVSLDEYVRIKAYNNKDLNKSEVSKRENEQSEIGE